MARDIIINMEGLGGLAADADRAALAFYRLAQSQEMAAAASRSAAQAKAQLSGALGNLGASLTQAFLPVYQVVLPALAAMLNGLAGVIALLTGRNVKAVDSTAKAYKAVASGAKKAAGANNSYKKSLASFDTIETINAPSGGGSGGGAGVGGLGALAEETRELPGWVTRLMEILERLKEFLRPVAEAIRAVLNDLWEGIVKAWEVYGEPILAAAKQGLENLAMLAQLLYTTVIEPILTALCQVLAELWEGHLAPLWDSLCLLLGQLTLTLLDIWNGVLVPVLEWLISTFGPAVSEVVQFILGVVGTITGFVADVVRSVTQFLTGLLEFVSVFAQAFGVVWDGIGEHLKVVWQGIWEFIRGIVNGIVDLVNGMVSAIVAGLNAVIRALNSLSINVPGWVPGYGGRQLGFSISQLSAPVIPHLATGAVIPPNNPYLAVVGDQRSGVNIETPLETMVEAFRQAQSGQSVNIRFTGDLAQLGRVLKPVLENESRRLGGSLITGGAL